MTVVNKPRDAFIIYILFEILIIFYFNNNYTEIKENLLSFSLYIFAFIFNILNLGLFFPRKGLITNELYPIF